VDEVEDVEAAKNAVSQLSHYDYVDEVFYDALIHFFDDLQVRFFNNCHHRNHDYVAIVVYTVVL